MLRTSCRSWLLPLLLACLPSACASYYRVDVGGDRPEQTHSVFVIVADRNPLGKDNPDVSGLIRTERISNYLLFAQFDPDGEVPLRWRQQSLECRSELIKVTLSEDQTLLKLRVDKELMTPYGELTIVVIGHGSERWYAETVEAGKIRSEGGIRLDVGASRFVRRQLP